MKLFLCTAFVVIPMFSFASDLGRSSKEMEQPSGQSDSKRARLCSISNKLTDEQGYQSMQRQAACNLRTLCVYAATKNRVLDGDRKKFKESEINRFVRFCAPLCIDGQSYFMDKNQILKLGEKIIK